MISAWQVYLVLQLDSIGATLSFLSTAGVLTLGVLVATNAFSKHDAAEFPTSVGNMEARKEAWAARSKWIKRIALITFPIMAFNAFLPSSKTVAAMIVLPAITSDKVIDTVAPEVRELYELTKDALRNLSSKPAAPEKKPD